MAREQPTTPVDDDISPYLQRPLRTLEKACEDRQRRQREVAGAEAKEEPNAE